MTSRPEPIVQCPLNFSEGRRPEVIKQVLLALTAISGIRVLDVMSDPSHNRTVVTLIGPPKSVIQSCLAGTSKAIEMIDMNTHTGAHPRIGAMDVIPVVPMSGIQMADCIRLAKELGGLIAEKHNIPVYLYGEAATIPERKNLAVIQRLQYETLKLKIKEPIYKPDFGPHSLHPTAGAVAIGAREVIIFFNLYLSTNNIQFAREIANAVRGSGGGFVDVKAIGVSLENNEVQVSTEITNYHRTPLYKVYDFVEKEAAYLGTTVSRTEIIGLLPQNALWDTAIRHLKLKNFDTNRILECKINQDEVDVPGYDENLIG